MPRAIAAALLLLMAVSARAFSFEDDGQFWAPVFLNLPSQGRLVGLLELQPRVRGDFQRLVRRGRT